MVKAVDRGDGQSPAKAGGLESRSGHRARWWALAWLVLALAVAWWWIDYTDMFCRRGYIANDGMCAWE